jgi:hypothetical protein
MNISIVLQYENINKDLHKIIIKIKKLNYIIIEPGNTKIKLAASAPK